MLKIKTLKYLLGNISIRIMIKAIFQRKEQMVHKIYKIEQTSFTVLECKNYCWNFILKNWIYW